MMSRLPAMHVAAVIALLVLCFCLLHASSAADTSLYPGLQENNAPGSLGANDQVDAAAGEAEEVGDGRMDLELEDYPGSGANDRHSPWWGQRRN